MIKAIETQWMGYRFRSRLEARWAVFFETVGLAWLYEPEGFDLGGLWYLPDFRLPGLRLWVECKAERQDAKDDWELCRRLAVETGDDVAMLFDYLGPLEIKDDRPGGWAIDMEVEDIIAQPSPDIVGPNRLWHGRAAAGREAGHWTDGCCQFGECPRCHLIGFGHCAQHERCACRCRTAPLTRRTVRFPGVVREEVRCGVCGLNVGPGSIGGPREAADHETWKRSDSPRLMRAYSAARSARFEHGEAP